MLLDLLSMLLYSLIVTFVDLVCLLFSHFGRDFMSTYSGYIITNGVLNICIVRLYIQVHSYLQISFHLSTTFCYIMEILLQQLREMKLA